MRRHSTSEGEQAEENRELLSTDSYYGENHLNLLSPYLDLLQDSCVLYSHPEVQLVLRCQRLLLITRCEGVGFQRNAWRPIFGRNQGYELTGTIFKCSLLCWASTFYQVWFTGGGWYVYAQTGQ